MTPTFPHFVPLTLEDREDYERLVVDYPPFSDISFTTLHIWWNLEGKLEVSLLNNNLVLNYFQSFDEKNSGLSLIGIHSVEESINTIFSQLKAEGKPARLVHVPEFVVNEILDRAKYGIEEELDYNEYILDSEALASLEDPSHGRTRRKVRRFLREVENRKVEAKELDLSTDESKQALLKAIISWESNQRSDNDPNHTEHQAIAKTMDHANKLGVEHLGLYIDDKLYAVILYHKSIGETHYILNHLKVDYSIPFIFDYMTHHIATKAAHENIKFLNMEMDLGIENLRRHKLGLRPVDFFRKFTITSV